ncbi:MAG: protein phosphatase CheZ [Alphaproteobacteria bacterium]
MTSARLESIVTDQMAAIQQSAGDSIPVNLLPDLLRNMCLSMETSRDPDLETLRSQIDEMQQFIGNARKEISSIRPNAMREIEIPDATDELDAVVMATEEATNAILDSVEKLGSICSSLTGADAEALEALVMKIYEASNFQDVTGQRISKVVNTLQGIESRVSKLVALFPGVDETDSGENDEEASLLNGPQLPGLANGQDDIDALFDNL